MCWVLCIVGYLCGSLGIGCLRSRFCALSGSVCCWVVYWVPCALLKNEGKDKLAGLCMYTQRTVVFFLQDKERSVPESFQPPTPPPSHASIFPPPSPPSLLRPLPLSSATELPYLLLEFSPAISPPGKDREDRRDLRPFPHRRAAYRRCTAGDLSALNQVNRTLATAAQASPESIFS